MPVQTAIQVRRGTASSWTSTNPTLAAGEIGFETDTGKFKIGTGSTAWASLPYAAIDAGLLAAKGDLVTATANDTPAVLTVGSNGETLVADSSASTGLRWQIGNGLAQGLINGAFDIWQRATSTSGNGYTCVDRFYVFGSGTSTFSRESSVVPTGFQYSFKHLAGATTSSSLAQVIETANAISFANQTVTVSGYFSASTATNFVIQLAYSTGTDTGIGGSWTNITANGTYVFAGGTGGTFTRGAAIFQVPSTAKSLKVTFAVDGNIANTVAVYYAGTQLEIGSTATTFRRAGGTLAGELAACQRYYYRATASAVGNRFGYGTNISTTEGQFEIKFPATMRTAPTALEQSGTAGDYGITEPGAATVAGTSVPTFVGASTFNGLCAIASTVGGLTAYRAAAARAFSATAYLGWSAEL